MSNEFDVIEAEDKVITPPAKTSKPRVGGYRLLAILVFLFAVGGLFIGMVSMIPAVGKFLGFISHVDGYQIEGQILKGSLLGYLVKFFMDTTHYTTILSAFKDSWSDGVVNIVNLAVHAMVVIAVVASLVCFILACIPSKTGKMTKRSAMWSAVLAFLGY